MPRRQAALALALVLAALVSACGKKGPPLPPLVLLPTPPGEFAAVRRGPTVDLTFRVPNSNTDRSTPADLVRVDVFALDVPAPVTADDVVRRGERVGTVEINKPKDPDEPEPETPAPKGPGLDQNELAAVSETLASGDVAGYRAYVVVGFNKRGRRGALSQRLLVPLVAPPSAPSQPRVTYDEKALTVTWPAVQAAGAAPFVYNVYRPGDPKALSASAVRDPFFVDNAIEWEKEHCYEVRTVSVVENVRIESAPSPSTCVTMHDTFPPAPPKGLVGVASEGSISLIWSANGESDLAGYVVLRAIEPATALTPLSETPMTDTNFRDTVPSGSRVAYAIVAVDKSGNRSAPSERITETAR